MELATVVRLAVCAVFSLLYGEVLVHLVGLLIPLGALAPVIFVLLVCCSFLALRRVYRP